MDKLDKIKEDRDKLKNDIQKLLNNFVCSHPDIEDIEFVFEDDFYSNLRIDIKI